MPGRTGPMVLFELAEPGKAVRPTADPSGSPGAAEHAASRWSQQVSAKLRFLARHEEQ